MMVIPSPLPPADPNAAVSVLAGDLSNNIIHVFTYAIPFVIGLLVLFTVLAVTRGWMTSGMSLGEGGAISAADRERNPEWFEEDSGT